MRSIANSTAIATPETLIDGAVRKAKNRLVPMIIIMYLIAYRIGRISGFAALRMNADLNLTPDLFGFAAGIFYVGYVIFEVPSNILLGRFGCNVWFARIRATWGLLSMASAGGMAICNAVGNIGGFFGPWILGYVKQRSGASAALYLCAAVVLIAPALVAYLRFTNKHMPWK